MSPLCHHRYKCGVTKITWLVIEPDQDILPINILSKLMMIKYNDSSDMADYSNCPRYYAHTHSD